MSLGYGRYYSGITNPNVYYAAGLVLNQSQYQATPYGQGGSFLTGGVNQRNDLVQAAQRNIQQAQRQAAMPNARAAISGQADYEKGGPGGGIALPDPLRTAIVAPEPDQVVSGDALNEILKEVIRVIDKGAKGPSAYIPPLLMDDLRFTGSPAADLLNLARQAGNLNYPAAFDDAALARLQLELDKDFTAVAVVVQDGKAPEAAKVAKLAATFQKVQDLAGEVIKNLPFEDAAAARRFLNKMSNAITALKSGAAAGLIDPKWSAEGLTVADLVKHMMRHKLLFGPAPRGKDEAYATMHRNLVTYLFVLTQLKK
jgi:hypothetical protein